MDREDLTSVIIGCAYKVYNTLGYGFLESVYEKCLLIELEKGGIQAQAQKDILVQYEGHIVGEFKVDILVDDSVIVELKSIKQLARIHEVQLVNYLCATGKDLGLLINFGEKGVEVKRKVRDIKHYSKKKIYPINSVTPIEDI
jgi:GxxExxY protein